MLTPTLTTRTEANAAEPRVGWVWSVVDDRSDKREQADHAHVEYVAGACPQPFFGTIGTKRRQPMNPRRAPYA